MERAAKILLKISIFMLAISIPLSIALDNVSLAIGGLALLLLLFSGKLDFSGSLKLLSFLIPEGVGALLNGAFKATSFKQHLFAYFIPTNALKEVSEGKVLSLLGISAVVSSIVCVIEAFTVPNVSGLTSKKVMKLLFLKELHFHLKPSRAVGLLNHPLTTSGVFLILLFLFFSYYLKSRQKCYLIFSFFSTLALIFTQSRSYWLALIFGIVFFVLLKRDRMSLIAVSLVGIFAFSVAAVPSFRARFESIFNTKTNTSNVIRLVIWRSCLDAFERNFTLKEQIFGAGERYRTYGYRYLKRNYKLITGRNLFIPKGKSVKELFLKCETHNIYLKYLMEFGIFGLLGYLLFIYLTVKENLKAYFQTKEPFLLSFASLYLAFALAGFFENNFADAEVKIALLFALGVNYYLLKSLKKARNSCSA